MAAVQNHYNPHELRRAFIKGRVPGKLTILPAWFDHLHVEESFSHKQVRFKMFCLPVKTSCLPAKNTNEIPDYD